MKKLIKFSVVILVVSLVSVVLAKPKAYVITGWYDDKNDKSWHDAIAQESKKDLEKAGYEVVLITDANSKQFKDAVNDPNAKALVFIDHGTDGMERVCLRGASGNKERVAGNDLNAVYHNFDIVTLHACDQNQPSWRNRFPDANFFAWTGSVYSSSELTWQKKKTYPDANAPQAGTSTVTPSSKLTKGKFIKDGASGIRYPINPLSGNWPMSRAQAMAFGNQIYNFFVSDDNLANAEIIFGAAVNNGVITEYTIDDCYTNPDFEITMTYGQFISAIENPYVLLNDNLLGNTIFIDDISGTGVSPGTLFAGVRRNMFFVTTSACEPVPDNGAYAVPIPVKLAWTASGVSGITHDVYFGTVSADVNSSDRSGAVYKGNYATGTTTYTPGSILLDKRYYWRVDEVQSYPTLARGDVWTFTTSPIFYADDFQTFASTSALKNVWKGTGTANNALVYQNTEGTDKSVRFWYDNMTSPYYSGIKRSVSAAQGSSRDYTFGGSGKSLRVSYKVDVNNPAIYVSLFNTAGTKSTKVKQPVTTDNTWQEAWFNLSDFGSVATNVKAIEIGDGNQTNPLLGQGNIYFNDVRIQAMEYVGELSGDINGSHKIDYNDVKAAADTWLDPPVSLVRNGGMNKGTWGSIPSNQPNGGHDPCSVNWPKYWYLWTSTTATQNPNYVLSADTADPRTKTCARLDLDGPTTMWNDGAICQTIDVNDYNNQELLVSFMHKGDITAPDDTMFEYCPVMDGCSTDDESGLPMLRRIQNGGSPVCDDCYGMLSWDWEPYTHVMTVNLAELDGRDRKSRYLHLHFRLCGGADSSANPPQYLKIDNVVVMKVGDMLPAGDITLDGKGEKVFAVDFGDFAVLANEWLVTQQSIP